MKVIFLEDVQGVAQAGDVKEVKNGFARNYLLPKKLASMATSNELQRAENLRKTAEQNRSVLEQEWRQLGENLEGTTLTIKMRSGETGRLYGSVTNAMIAEELTKVSGRDIDRRGVTLEEPIREIGNHEVSVRLYTDVAVSVNVIVETEAT